MSGQFVKKRFWCCQGLGFAILCFAKTWESGRLCELENAEAAAQNNERFRKIVAQRIGLI